MPNTLYTSCLMAAEEKVMQQGDGWHAVPSVSSKRAGKDQFQEAWSTVAQTQSLINISGIWPSMG